MTPQQQPFFGRGLCKRHKEAKHKKKFRSAQVIISCHLKCDWQLETEWHKLTFNPKRYSYKPTIGISLEYRGQLKLESQPAQKFWDVRN